MVERDVDVEVLEDVELEVEVLVEVDVLEDVDEVDVEVDVEVEVDVLEEIEVELLMAGVGAVLIVLVVLVVLVPPITGPAWTTNDNPIIARTAMLNTIPTLLIDIFTPNFTNVKCCNQDIKMLLLCLSK